MSKPDRFEQMVEAIILGDGHRRFVWEKECLRLLRRQHAAYVRLVKQRCGSMRLASGNAGHDPMPYLGVEQEILAAFKHYKKGMP